MGVGGWVVGVAQEKILVGGGNVVVAVVALVEAVAAVAGGSGGGWCGWVVVGGWVSGGGVRCRLGWEGARTDSDRCSLIRGENRAQRDVEDNEGPGRELRIRTGLGLSKERVITTKCDRSRGRSP